jgi:hypothetical protein
MGPSVLCQLISILLQPVSSFTSIYPDGTIENPDFGVSVNS